VCRLLGEGVSVWVLLYHPTSVQHWGGFDDLLPAELLEVLSHRPLILLLGGTIGDVQSLMKDQAALLSGTHTMSNCRGLISAGKVGFRVWDAAWQCCEN